MNSVPMDNLTKKIRSVEEAHASELVASRLESYSSEQRDLGLMVLGGFRVSERISAAVAAEGFKALMRFAEEKLYEAFGFTNMVDFLNDSPHAPMTKAQFYERRELYGKEGERLFDLFTELGLSIRKRKLLGQGNVAIEGENAVIRDDSGEETVVPISDQARLIEVITAVVDSKVQLRKDLEKQKEKIEQQKETIRLAHDDLDRERARKSVEALGDTHSMALAAVIGAFKNLRDEVAGLSEIDRGARKDHVLELLAGQMQLTAEAYGSADWARHAPRPERAPTGDDEADYVEDLLDRVLDGEVVDPEENERELAAAMS